MKKNKKGKKKNKMAGRNGRPDKSPGPEEADVPQGASDTSETEEQVEAGENLRVPPRDCEGHACHDSGIDSGRGSPGDDPVHTSTADDGKPKENTEDVEDTTDANLQNENSPKSKSSVSPGSRSPKSGSRSPRPDSKSPKSVSKSPRSVSRSPRCENMPNNKSSKKADSKSPPKRELKLPTNQEAEVEAKLENKSNSRDNIEERVRARSTDGDIDRKLDNELDNQAPVDNSDEEGKAVANKAPSKTSGAVSFDPDQPVEMIKHPLEFKWVFWLIRQNVPWKDALFPGAAFDTIEDFWYFFNVLKNPRALKEPIQMFKDGIRPEWESSGNKYGGRWNLVQGLKGKVADEVWHELVLMMIGGLNFGPLTPHINGIYCAWKSDGLHFSVWIDTIDESIANSIGNTIHSCLRKILGKSFRMELMQLNREKRRLEKPLYFIK